MKIENKEIDTLFPTAVQDSILNDEEYIQQIENEIYRLKDLSPEGQSISNYGGWQSPRNAWWDGTSPILEELGMKLLPHMKKYYSDTQKNDRVDDLKLQSIWGNISNKHAYNNLHIHSGAQVSGILYIKAPKYCGNVVFVNPSANLKMCEAFGDKTATTPFNNDRFFYEPKRGRLLLFPSYLGHEVEPNITDEDRISIAFNASFYAEE